MKVNQVSLLPTCSVYGAFTMETIFATSFGRIMDIQKGQSNELTKAAEIILSTDHEQNKNSFLSLHVTLSKIFVCSFCWS